MFLIVLKQFLKIVFIFKQKSFYAFSRQFKHFRKMILKPLLYGGLNLLIHHILQTKNN